MNPLTLQEKIGQLMVFGFDGLHATEEIKELISKQKVGGIILFGRNIGTPDEVLRLTNELQSIAKKSGHKHPLLICVDQENGVVRRLGKGATVFPGAMLLGATHNPDLAYEIGLATGKELKSLGINWNLAPVLDINNNPHNPVIGVRSFGEKPDIVSQFGLKAMQGMQDAGVITTLKHFPGHGDTNLDSHLDLPTIPYNIDRLEQMELKPFKKCIDNGADIVMTAHIYYPSIEDRVGVPATLSKKIITGILRDKLKFSGVVTTDCLEMNAVSKTIGTAKGAVEALKSGVDLIMISHHFHYQMEALKEISKQLDSGELSVEAIDVAYERVAKLKEKYLSWDALQLNGQNIVQDVVGCKEHRKLAEIVYRKGITIVKNKDNVLPLSTNSENQILVLYPENSAIMQVEDRKYSEYSLGVAIKEIYANTDFYCYSLLNLEKELDIWKEKIKKYDIVIIGTMSVKEGDPQISLVNASQEICPRTIIVALRNPYDLAYLPTIPCYIATYEFTSPALQMAAKAIFGMEDVTGRLPVTIPFN